MGLTLTELGKKHSTDKAYHHHFTDFYEPFLLPLKNKTFNLLEIGIETGASLFMWADFFTNANIYAFDIVDKKYIQEDEDRIYIEQGDQGDVNFLENVFPQTEFEIIVDDGSHNVIHQQLSLKTLFKRLAPGGFYILEDLHTSRCAEPIPHPNSGNRTTLQLIENLQNNNETKTEFYISNSDIDGIKQQIELVQLYRRADYSITSIIKKKLTSL